MRGGAEESGAQSRRRRPERRGNAGGGSTRPDHRPDSGCGSRLPPGTANRNVRISLFMASKESCVDGGGIDAVSLG